MFNFISIEDEAEHLSRFYLLPVLLSSFTLSLQPSPFIRTWDRPKVKPVYPTSGLGPETSGRDDGHLAALREVVIPPCHTLWVTLYSCSHLSIIFAYFPPVLVVYSSFVYCLREVLPFILLDSLNQPRGRINMLDFRPVPCPYKWVGLLRRHKKGCAS